MKLNELEDKLTAKTAELQEKSVEVRSAVEDDEKSVDDVKTGMSEVDELKKEISDIEADIKALKDAAGIDIPKKDDEEPAPVAPEKRDGEDEVLPDEGNSDDASAEDEPEINKKKEDKDVEKRDLGGMEDMKKNVAGATEPNAVEAFGNYLKSGETRDVTGLKLSDGAVIIPETILNPEHEEYQFPRLGSLVRTVSVTTTTGKLPVFMNSTDKLAAHKEYDPTAANAAPEIKPIMWDLKSYTGAYVFSQELISDSSYNWESELRSRLVELRDNTDDSLIIDALTDGITPVESEDLIADIKTALNVTLKPQDSAQASVVLSQSAYDAIDHINDGEGRPMLQPNIAQGTGKLFLGKQVIVLDDALFPEGVNAIVAPLQKAVINFKLTEITGQFQDTYDVWYKQLGIFLRENVVQARPELIVNLNGTVAKPASSPKGE